ncbi:hypothetical protein SAMN05421736_1591, partial [Evansella caseinilytica]
MDLADQLSRGLAEIKSGKAWNAATGTFSTQKLKMDWTKPVAVAWQKRLMQKEKQDFCTYEESMGEDKSWLESA